MKHTPVKRITNMNTLNMDCIGKIFAMTPAYCVTRFSMVCKDWYNVVAAAPVTATVCSALIFTEIHVAAVHFTTKIVTYVNPTSGVRTFRASVGYNLLDFYNAEVTRDDWITPKVGGVYLGRTTEGGRDMMSLAGFTPVVLRSIFAACMRTLAA
jgi:hypothetical protein